MMQRMQEFDLLRPRIVVSDLGEEISYSDYVGRIRAAVSVASGSTVEQNQALRISSTHRAITQDDVRTGDRFGGYIVDYAIPGRRFTQLFLTKEDSIHDAV